MMETPFFQTWFMPADTQNKTEQNHKIARKPPKTSHIDQTD
jgi:hypothetical protein